MERLILFFLTLIILSGCTAFQYGYDSNEYEGRLVNASSEEGKVRIDQIKYYDQAAENLLLSGYQPEFLYENWSDDFYFLSPSTNKHFHLVRESGTKSKITPVTRLPNIITALLPSTAIPSNTEVITAKVISEAVVKEEKPQAIEPLIDVYTTKDKGEGIVILGFVRQGEIPPADREKYRTILYAEILSDRVYEVEQTVRTTSDSVITGYRSVQNPNYARAQVAYQNALRKYQEAHNMDLQGYNNGTALLAGVLQGLSESQAEENLEKAHLKLYQEPQYKQIPQYKTTVKKIPVYNFERVTELRFYKFVGSKKAGVAVIEKRSRTSSESTSASNRESTMNALSRENIRVWMTELDFK